MITLFCNHKNIVSIFLFLSIFMVFGIQITSYGDVTPVTDRTSQVRDAIVTAAGVNTADEVTETHLTAITSLNLRNAGISELQSGDFSGLTGLTNLNLYGNQLSSLPDGIFEGLTALTTLRLGGNTVDPLPISVSLEKVADGQFKAVAPTGAPFDIIIPISATNGSIADSTTSLTISKGSTESNAVTVSRTADTTTAVTANIGTLPSLPSNHYGYVLTKSDTLPLEVISAVPDTTPVDPTPVDPVDPVDPIEPIDPIEPETPTNTAPTFTDGTITIRSIAENTPANTNIGSVVSATDVNEDDTLTYSLRGTDAASFVINSTTGQLKTKAALDYETKRVYIITITASDSSLTDTITVIISIIDVADTSIGTTTLPVSDRTPEVRDAIVAAVPNITAAADVTDTHLATITSLNLRNAGIAALKTGDFGGLTALTSINLYGNMLSSLPIRIFEGLTSLTSVRLGGNAVDPMLLPVSLQQVDINQFKAIIPTGAPFDVVLPINGASITAATISKGSLESVVFTATTDVYIGTLPASPSNHFGYILAKSNVCNRTFQVSDAIVNALQGIDDCRNVTEVHLATITSLDLSGMGIASLDAGDFAGMLSLTTLNLSNNQLSNLPDGIFEDLTSLTTLNLNGNSVDPVSLLVSLEKVGTNQVKVVVPTGAPFDIALPISVANGSIDGTTLTISTGNVGSQTLTVTRTAGTTAAVTVAITLPNLPSGHTGYALVKSNQQPLDVFEDINMAPVLIEGATTARTIAENTEAGTNIGTPISATDTNDDTLIYTLSGTDAAEFNIDSETGQLKTKTSLDYETKSSYSVTITVSDGSLSDTINVTINVTDVDENRAPVFTEGSSATRTVAENTGSGVNIGTAVAATDADADTLTYSLDGTDASAYSLNTTTGQLRTDASLDYETKSSYSVTITASDGNGGSDTITVTINITDINEVDTTVDVKDDIINKVPVFSEGETATRSIAENTGSGVDIGAAVAATDADNDTLTYNLEGTDAAKFSIDSSSGQLRTRAALDYEIKTSYSVTITVSDGNGGSDSIIVTITITDVDERPSNITPEFADGSNTTRAITENIGAGVDIGTPIAATDADADTLIYTLGGTDATSFNINSTNGQLRTSAALDYETKSSYTVTITVSDGNGGSDSIIVTITITDVDERPTNIVPEFMDGSSTTRSVAENTGAGVDIGTAIAATDTDAHTLIYTLGGTDATSFSINSTNGQIRTRTSLDYETKSSYTLTVSVSDGNGGSDSIIVTITITDVDETPTNNPPIFTEEEPSRSIAENTNANVDIGSPVTATDEDNQTLNYSLTGTDADSFDIEPSTGQLKTEAALNHEAKPSYTVTVNVSDGLGGNDNVDVTIEVTDVNEAPVFADTGTTRSIAENAGANINIGSAVSATDVDANTTLTYTLSGIDAAAFDIEPTTGQLKTKAALDYETKNSYSVIISVSDSSLTDTITVTINIRDLDETPSNIAPVFTDGEATTRSVPENTATDTDIGTSISATDEDSITLAYLLSGDDASTFSIDEETGQLKTSAALNYEDKTSYTLTVTVSDGSLDDEITVTINVTNVNESPVFADGESTTRRVPENTDADENFGQSVSATDPDTGDTLTYSLEGTDAASFDIEPTIGQLKTKAALDFETKESYSVTVKVADSGALSDTIAVTINVRDVDENRAPIFTDGETAIRAVAENTGAGVDIGNPVAATDADNDTMQYTLGGTDAGTFNIGSITGQLRTKDALDFEDKQSYTVTITVSDGNNATDTITVTINVTDVDENRAPVFTDGETATRAVAENTGAGVDIGTAVAATDADNDTLEYTLGGTDAAAFSIGSITGQLRTKDALDYEDTQSYTVTITVSDGNNATDTITVTINVTDVDENRAPIFTDGETATRAVAENTGAGVDIGTAVAATDVDNDTLEYTLGGTDAAAFSIGSITGQLRTKDALDFEDTQSYTVTITVSDGNNATDTITVTINVTDVDENRAPIFTDGETATRAVAENTGAGVDIGSVVAATDADNDTLEYTLGGTDAATFSIDSTSGQLKTKDSLNYEDDTSHAVRITVSDDKGGEDTITVTINVTDANDTPVFSETVPVTRAVDENTATEQNIGSPISATDEDGDTLEYSLGGTDASSFSIVSTSGQLKTKDALDYEDDDAYTVTVSVSDNNGGNASIDVTINVTDVFENSAPTFLVESFAYEIDDIEAASVGDNIGDALTATDTDNDTLTYSVGGDDASKFAVDSSGQLTVTQALLDDTRTNYSIKVIADDGNGGMAEVSGTVRASGRVSMQLSNNRPVFSDGTSTTRAIPENTASGENIGDAIAATDADTSDTLTYTLEGTDAASFSIVSTSGQLQTSASLDYETKTSYSVTVKATDDSGETNASVTIAVTINVTDVDEGSTTVSDGITPVTERTPEVRDAIVAAVRRADSATEVTNTHLAAIRTLDLSSMSIASLKNGDFSGLSSLRELDLSFNTLSSLPADIFEGLSSLSTLRLYGNFISSLPADIFEGLSALVRLSIGDYISSLPTGIFEGLSSLGLLFIHSPKASLPITVSLKKVAAGQFKATVDTGATLNLVLPVSVNNGSISGGATSITVRRGKVESDTTLTVTRTPGSAAAVTVYIGTLPIPHPHFHYGYKLVKSSDLPLEVFEAEPNNHAPIFTTSNTTTFAIVENTASGVNIGSAVSATDQDTADTLTYSLGGTDASAFDIAKRSGQLKTRAPLNYETKNSYSVTIAVTDESLTETIEATINVTNVNEVPMFSDGATTTRSVTDSTASGENIGDAVSAIDDDNDTLIYSLSGTDASSFSIVTTTGQLQTSDTLDIDIKNEYSVTVSVVDGNMGTASIDVTINVIYERPPTSIFDRSERMQITLRDTVRALPGVNNRLELSEINVLHMNQITSIIIHRNDNKGNLQSGDFDDLPVLTSISMYDRELNNSSIPSDIFDGLSALTTLDMSFNEFSNLPSGIFDGLSALTTLKLNNNEFSSLPTGIFAGLSALTTLDLSNNESTSLPAGIFDELSALITLDMNHNDFTSLPAGIFDELSALTTLDMNYNDFTSLPAGFFNSLSSLTTLNISYCVDLTSVDVNLFEGLSQLTTLYMNDTKISSLPEGLFDNTPKLKTLNLSNLPISTLPSDIFDGLSELRTLRLNYSVGNSLTSLPSDVFDGLSLEQLRFNNNGLASLPDGIFKGLTSLIVLEVGDQRPDTNVMDLIDMDINVSLIDDGSGAFKAKAHTGAPTMIRVVVDVQNGTIDGDTRTTVNIPAGSVESDSISVTRTVGTTDAVTVRMGNITEPGKTPGFVGYQLVKLTTTPLEIYAAGLGAPTVVSKPVSPTITMFLPNFPNPFNPETWIPYQLSKSADVSLTIYNMRGVIVRKLALGHQLAGYYTSWKRAAHWDGRNNIGERVATGVYFCTIKAGDYTATRKMLIRK